MIWHFAHKSKENCVKYYDNKGKWHREMQNIFPEKNQEIFNNEFNRHIFDVLTDDKTIIEFQKYPINLDDFNSRTNDYVNFAIKNKVKKPVWIFNFEDKIFERKNRTYKENNRLNLYRWHRPKKIFGDVYNFSNKNYVLFFLINPYSENDFMLSTVWNGQEEITVRKLYDENTSKLDKVYLRVTSISNNGKTIIGEIFQEQEFIRLLQSFIK